MLTQEIVNSQNGLIMPARDIALFFERYPWVRWHIGGKSVRRVFVTEANVKLLSHTPRTVVVSSGVMNSEELFFLGDDNLVVIREKKSLFTTRKIKGWTRNENVKFVINRLGKVADGIRLVLSYDCWLSSVILYKNFGQWN